MSKHSAVLVSIDATLQSFSAAIAKAMRTVLQDRSGREDQWRFERPSLREVSGVSHSIGNADFKLLKAGPQVLVRTADSVL